MLDLAIAKQCVPTDAQRFSDEIQRLGASVLMLVPPVGRPSLAFQFTIIPPSPRTLDVAQHLRARFEKDAQFQKDLFGWLFVEGLVFQRYAEHQPRVRLDGWDLER